MKMTDDPNSVHLILQLIDTTVILHNMLIEFGEEEKGEWADCDDFSDYDDKLHVPFRVGDVISSAVAALASKDACCNQLLCSFFIRIIT